MCEDGLYCDWPQLRTTRLTNGWHDGNILHQLVCQWKLPDEPYGDELITLARILTRYSHLIPINTPDRYGSTVLHELAKRGSHLLTLFLEVDDPALTFINDSLSNSPHVFTLLTRPKVM
jgi:ankyrin repeat protein